MEDKKILLDNIDKIHTTEMGIDRIKRNLKIDTADVVEYCKNKVYISCSSDFKLIQYRIDRNILTVIPLLCKHRFMM